MKTAGLLTLREAAIYLNRPLATLQYWAHRVRLFPIYHVGVGRGRVMVKQVDLDALLERTRRAPWVDGRRADLAKAPRRLSVVRGGR